MAEDRAHSVVEKKKNQLYFSFQQQTDKKQRFPAPSREADNIFQIQDKKGDQLREINKRFLQPSSKRDI